METDVRSRDGQPSEPFSSSDALLWACLAHLQLNIAQTAALCGISVRQLGYWTKQGYVTADGHGERRTYGLDALRRILSIRRTMAEGASLRQALKSQTASVAAIAPAEERLLAYSGTEKDTRPSEDWGALTHQLVALFDEQRNVHDSADGLAIKLGRTPAAVRRVAETLCAQGVLGKVGLQNEEVYRRLEGAV